MKRLRNRFHGILGIAGGVILFALLSLALYEVPRALNLWLALFVSVLMIAAGVVALRWEHRKHGPGEFLDKEGTAS